ncbi:hypothetical protein [Herbidospora mongoliensis]|uniref:hypothetical protein n=1 Tax=Herbidospora mongoliensis TaxID=688067 RepID=UPI000AA2B8F5|nr:hypothetical protein [Herbidospora mongoliensis]
MTWRLAPAAWPIAAFLVGYPVWWALGFGGLSIVVVAIPMAVVLWLRRPIRIPRGMGLWALLIVGYLVSAVMLDATPAGTYGEFGVGRLIGYAMRLAVYVALFVVVLYLGNLTKDELPQLTLVRMLGVLFLTAVAGGVLGILAPGFEFTAPMEYLLPDHPFVTNLVHPTAAQIQYVLGHAAPRPEAPFEWANAWGGNVSILLVWFVVGWWIHGGPARRTVAVIAVGIAAVPIVYSLNRGLWAAIAIGIAYMIIRNRNRAALLILATATGAAFVLSPLGQVVAARVDRPHSNDIRAHTVVTTIKVAATSPVIGYGNTRDAFGSHRTITTGKTGWCRACGHPPLGSDGQLWLLLITQGFTGAALYVGFFAGAIRRHWHDRSPIGQAGSLVMLLVLFYMFIYDGLVSALTLYLISFAVLWRNAT